jgi:ATP-dependent Lon protease
MPGRIIQALGRVGSRDPLFMLDEVDKIGADWRGDPTSALLEVLDPMQNSAFRDHYLDVDFDLSEVLFICTANTVGPIPAALVDRMEVIPIEGYADHDKLSIAREHLVPRQLRANGLRPEEVAFTDEGLMAIVRDHTREAGVRSLEREIGRLMRKVAAQVAADGNGPGLVVDADAVCESLGKPRYRSNGCLASGLTGVATGLAWTPSGGEALAVEARVVSDSGFLILTGQLGIEMQESAHIAFSYVQGEAPHLGMPSDALRRKTAHFHVPAGSVPKDGPSAGLALVAALCSALSGLPVRDGVGMTGEITLRGQVLPVGGVKQKVLAAHRYGLRTVILPVANEADLDDVPESVRGEITFVLVDHIDQALDAALPIPVEFEPLKPSGIAPAVH